MLNPEAFFPMLERVARVLDRCGVRFLITGGLVAVFYAEPRLTQDADLVVDPDQLKSRLDDFIQALQQLNYVSDARVIRDAVSRGRMFQILDPVECLKIDFYPRELVAGELNRAHVAAFTSEFSFPIISRPDLVISKLVWISKGSHKSRRDVRQIMLRATPEEERMVRELARSMELTPLFDEVLAEPDEIDA
ncbi:MAG: nucleotidyl transferase AbiEii/AbiGii toxin family protein [Planctomycetaceae bacterium]